MERTLPKRMISRIATDAHQLTALFDDAHTPRLPRCAELLYAVCVRTIAFIARVGCMVLT